MAVNDTVAESAVGWPTNEQGIGVVEFADEVT
jgi:hypothetical protein